MSRVEQAVHLGRCHFQGFEPAAAHRGAVFVLELVDKRCFGDFRAAVATHFFGQLATAFFQRRQGFLVHELEDVEAVVGAHRTGDVPRLFNGKSGVLEGLHHLARAKPRQQSAFVGRRGVLAVLHGHGFKGFAAHQQALHFHDAAFCIRDLVLGGVVGHAHHDVGHLDFSACLPLACDLQHVVPKPRAHHLAHFAFGGVEGGVFEGVDHLECGEPSEVSTVARHRGIFAAPFASCHGFKIFSVDDTAAQRLDAVPGAQCVGGCSVGVHADEHVAGAHFHAFALERLLHQFVQQRAIDEVWTGQLGAVAGEFFLERSSRVHAEGLGFKHLQLEVDKQLHVLVEGLHGVHAVPVVLPIHMGEVGQAHQLVAHLEDVGLLGVGARIGSALTLGERREGVTVPKIKAAAATIHAHCFMGVEIRGKARVPHGDPSAPKVPSKRAIKATPWGRFPNKTCEKPATHAPWRSPNHSILKKEGQRML